MRYKFFYSLFFIASILYSSFRLPLGVTPRNIMSLVMLVVCFYESRHFFLDKWFGIYLIFIAFFSLSSALTGYSSSFNHWFIGYFVVAYIGYWATMILIKKYDGYSLVLKLFVGIGLLDALVTVGQFYNIPFILQIPNFLGISSDVDMLAELDANDTALGLVLPGILTNDVYNGYFIMSTGILSLYFLKDGFRIFKLLPWLLFSIASFMVQQRAPFYIFMIASVAIFIKVTYITNSRYKYIYLFLLLILIPVMASYLLNFLTTSGSRFSLGMESTNRNELFAQSIQFIKDNTLIGGFFGSHIYPHNLFLGAWICGGIFGFVSIVVLTCMQFGRVFKSFFSKIRDSRNYLRMLFGMSFLSFGLNSLFHNAGLYTGDLILWILWGAFTPLISTYNDIRSN